MHGCDGILLSEVVSGVGKPSWPNGEINECDIYLDCALRTMNYKPSAVF